MFLNNSSHYKFYFVKFLGLGLTLITWKNPHNKFLKFNFFILYKMETSKKTYQSVEGIKIYKTRKYVQDEKTKQNCETRRLRDQYLKDHKEEILKLKHNQRIKKANELLKQDLNLNVNYNTLYSALKKVGIL